MLHEQSGLQTNISFFLTVVALVPVNVFISVNPTHDLSKFKLNFFRVM